MIKKLVIIFLINFFFFFLFTQDVSAIVCGLDMKWCKKALGAPKDKCCRDSSCSGTGCGATGTIYKWEFCKAYDCCANLKEQCDFYGWDCYEGWKYSYKYEKCSVADSCRNTKYLQPGLCLDSGCAKGGDYKICCTYPYDGTVCPNNCTGGNTRGVCPSGCRNPGPNTLTCPGTPIATPTPTPTKKPTPTPTPTKTPTPTPTPTPVPSCTMSLSPLSLSMQTGQSAILTANVNLVNATVKQVNFTSADTSIAVVNPSSDSDSPYRTQVTGNKVGLTTINAQAILSPSGSCTTTVPMTVESAAWFQTQGGDVYTGASLSNNIPSTADNRNLSLELDNWPGIVVLVKG